MFDAIVVWFESVHPLVFLLGLALCPLLPIPVSPLWVLAGMRFGPGFGILMSAVGLALNFFIAYLLSTRFLRRQIEWVLNKRKIGIPQIPQGDQIKFALLIRVVPGNPLFVQNYLLGIARVSFPVYFSIGLLVQMFYAVGFILFGEALFEGRVGLLVFAICLICAAVLVIKLLSKRLLRTNGAGRFPGVRD